MSEPTLVVVEWYDAWVDGTDTVNPADPDPRHHATLMQTLGWLVRDTELGVSIFNERCIDDDDGSYRSRTFIPRGMIKSITPFIMSKPRTRKVVPPPLLP